MLKEYLVSYPQFKEAILLSLLSTLIFPPCLAVAQRIERSFDYGGCRGFISRQPDHNKKALGLVARGLFGEERISELNEEPLSPYRESHSEFFSKVYELSSRQNCF